jgi:hypothetical protein
MEANKKKALINAKHRSSSLIFILSLHRSGSSILYDMLGRTECFNIITNYHILNYDQLVQNHDTHREEEAKENLRIIFNEQNITERGIDRFQVTPNTPQEYGYLYLRNGYPLRTCEKNKWLLENLVHTVQHINENTKAVLLKNPYDFSNFLYLKEQYPTAKFIFLHRNPFDTLNSLMNTWRTILRKKNKYTALMSTKYEGLFSNPLSLLLARLFYMYPFSLGFFSEVYSMSCQTMFFLQNIENIPPSDFINITYEELNKAPNNTMNTILGFLHMKTDLDVTMIVHARNLERIKEIQMFRKYIYNSMQPYFEFFNYFW